MVAVILDDDVALVPEERDAVFPIDAGLEDVVFAPTPDRMHVQTGMGWIRTLDWLYRSRIA